jgi:hypothetical protein
MVDIEQKYQSGREVTCHQLKGEMIPNPKVLSSNQII